MATPSATLYHTIKQLSIALSYNVTYKKDTKRGTVEWIYSALVKLDLILKSYDDPNIKCGYVIPNCPHKFLCIIFDLVQFISCSLHRCLTI